MPMVYDAIGQGLPRDNFYSFYVVMICYESVLVPASARQLSVTGLSLLLPFSFVKSIYILALVKNPMKSVQPDHKFSP